MKTMRWIFASALLALTAPAAADTASLFRDGKFAEAAAAGVKEATPAAQELAARSLLALAAYRTTDKERALVLIDQAGKLATAAMRGDARNTGALLQTAIATGYRAKLLRDPGDGKAARKLMEQARTLAPNSALAWASLGGWHGETVATLSPFIAATIMGAKKSESFRSFDKALALDPTAPVYPIFYALTLLSLDADNAPKAKALLIRAVALPAADGFEALLKGQAQQVLPLLQRNDAAGARTLARRLQPFGTLAG